LKVSVLRREGLLGIDSGDRRRRRLVWIRVEEDARGLTYLDLADLAFRNKAAQVDLGQVNSVTMASRQLPSRRLCRARRHGPGEGRADNQVLAIVFRFREFGGGLLGLRGRACDLGLLLGDLTPSQGNLRLANVGVGERS